METRAASNGVFPPLLILTALPALPTGMCRLSGALPPSLRVPAPPPLPSKIFQQFSIDRALPGDDVVANCRVETNLSSYNHTSVWILFQIVVFNVRQPVINFNGSHRSRTIAIFCIIPMNIKKNESRLSLLAATECNAIAVKENHYADWEKWDYKGGYASSLLTF